MARAVPSNPAFSKVWCIVASAAMRSIEARHGRQYAKSTTIVARVPMPIVMAGKPSVIKNPLSGFTRSVGLDRNSPFTGGPGNHPERVESPIVSRPRVQSNPAAAGNAESRFDSGA